MTFGGFMAGRWHGSLVERPTTPQEVASAIQRREEQRAEWVLKKKEANAAIRRLDKQIAKLREEPC